MLPQAAEAQRQIGAELRCRAGPHPAVLTKETRMQKEGFMKRLLLSLGVAASLHLVGMAATPGMVGLSGQLRCIKAGNSVDGISDEQAILFEEVGFICQPE
jgi:hypothetical protein